MDVRAKQRLSYQRLSLNFMLTSGGFAPRHLNRSMPRGEIRLCLKCKELFEGFVV